MNDPLLKLLSGVYLFRLLAILAIGYIFQFDFYFQEFLVSSIWLAGEFCLLYLLFLLLRKHSSFKMGSIFLLALTCISMIIWTIADPIVVKLAGDHLTPSLFAHFAGPQIFLSDELWLPIKANYLLVLSGAVLIALFVYLIFKMTIRTHQQRRPVDTKAFLKLLGLAILLLGIPYMIHPRFTLYPPEILFARNALGIDKYSPDAEEITALQQWLKNNDESMPDDPQYPLVTSLKGAASDTLKPNIILLVVESVRAMDMKLYNPDHGQMELPGHESFGRNGLVFPYCISNGYPSSEGFTSLSMGVWPHNKDRILISHKDVKFPSVACALRTRGYETYRIEDVPDMKEEGFRVRPTFNHHITFDAEHLFPSMKSMVDTLQTIVEKHTLTGKPYYVHLKTRNPHYPYDIADNQNKVHYKIGRPHENYKVSMKEVDSQIQRLHEYLVENNLFDNTVVILTGDHSNCLDKGHSTTLPNDETVWTGAIISGPQKFIGKADTILEHASQVDISRTALYLGGYQSSWVLFGRNLLKRKAIEHTYAIAVRPAGIRLDYGGNSYLLDRSHPSELKRIEGLGLSVKSKDKPPLSPLKLMNLVDTYSYLIDQDRVFQSQHCSF